MLPNQNLEKMSFFLTREDYFLSGILVDAGLRRSYDPSIEPDFFVIPDRPYSPVHPYLYNRDVDASTMSGLLAKEDYTDFCFITAAKLASVPIIGIGKGANLLHTHNGGTLESKLPHYLKEHYNLYDENLEIKEGFLLPPMTSRQIIDFEDVNFLNLYSKILVCKEKNTVQSFFCEERKQLGVSFPVSSIAGKKYFTQELLPLIEGIC